MPFWSKFAQKWITYNNHPSFFYVNYSDLIHASFTTISGIIHFCNSKADLKNEKLHKIIDEADIHPKNDLKNFKYFEPKLLKNIEKSLADEMKLAKIDPLF